MEIVLPLEIADEKDLPAAASAGPVAATAHLDMTRPPQTVAEAERTGTLVLVADDHSTNRMLLSRQLNVLGYACEIAENGLEALEKWRSGRFGAVITDVNMPELDGYGLARHIRQIELQTKVARTPIIACTANAMHGEAEVCLAAGMDDYLKKPVQLAELSVKLGQWLPLPTEPETAPRGDWQGSPAAEATAPGAVDRCALAEISGGVASVEQEILEDFARAAGEDAVALRRAARSKDAAGMGSAAHRIKGAARMVGASRLAETCDHIEQAGRAQDLDSAVSGMSTFEKELERLQAYVVSLSNTPPQHDIEHGGVRGDHHATA
jgi:CheY-like chemotaxis protein